MYKGLWPPKFPNEFVLSDNLGLTIITDLSNTSKDYF